MRLFLAIVFLCFMDLIGFGQHHVFRKVTIALPSPECYRIIQDKNGFIWVATEQGLCRYDGQNTFVFNAENGLKEKAVYALKEDSNGVLWALSKSGRLLQIKNTSIRNTGIYNLNRLSSIGKIGYDFFFIKNQIVIPFGYGEAKTYHKTTKQISTYRSTFPFGTSFVVVDKGNVIPYSISMPFMNTPPNRIIYFNDKQRPYRNQYVKVPTETIISSQIISCSLHERSFFSLANHLIEIDAKGKQHIHFFPHRILSLYPDTRGGLWVGVLGYGLYYIEKGNFSIPPVRSLPGLSVSNITEDREGHIWCTTLEKGVYRCQQPKIIFYNNFDGLRRKMDYLSNDNDLFIASSRFSELMTIDQQHRTNRITLNGKSAEVITIAKTIDNQFFIGYKERLYAGYLTNNSIELKQRKDFPGLNFLQFKERFGLIYGIGYWRIFCYRKGKFVPIINRLEDTPRCFLPIDSNRFLVVLFDRVQLYESTNGIEKVKTIPRAPESIVKLFYAKKSKRVFALTKGSGLFEWKNNQFVSCNRALRISIDVLNDGLEDERGNVWFATNEGLIKCAWNGKAFGKAKVFNELHGLPSKVCDKLAVNGNEMAVSTTEGLITFPLNHSLESSIAPQLFVRSTMINGTKMELQQVELSHEQNSIQINCSVLSYHQSGGQSLSYTLEHDGVVEKGKSTTNLLLQNLDPGTYQLKIFGRNVYGLPSVKPVQFDFYILPPFWATWWFILFLVLVGLTVIYLLIVWIQRRTEKRAEQANQVKMQLAKSQLSALQAQMNPHFIFNSISSIQNFIMSNKREEAYDYLTSFSKLIRNTLNNSRSQFISLSKELETIQLYMQLEQRRYNNKFDFHHEISPELDPESIVLPASLIQPLLENAVWHGVMMITSGQRGKIKLEILQEDAFLRINVTDNGGGLKESNAAHQSLAISIIEEQLALLSINSEKNTMLKVELKTAPNGVETLATFKIPLLKKL
jgi:ligand-binding sensor domain-containing protein